MIVTKEVSKADNSSTRLTMESNHEVNEHEYLEELEEGDADSSFYTEKQTSLLYEVKLFSDHALVRLIMPEIQVPVHRIDILTFSELFEEFNGSAKELRRIMFGAAPSRFLVEKNEKSK